MGWVFFFRKANATLPHPLPHTHTLQAGRTRAAAPPPPTNTQAAATSPLDLSCAACRAAALCASLKTADPLHAAVPPLQRLADDDSTVRLVPDGGAALTETGVAAALAAATTPIVAALADGAADDDGGAQEALDALVGAIDASAGWGAGRRARATAATTLARALGATLLAAATADGGATSVAYALIPCLTRLASKGEDAAKALASARAWPRLTETLLPGCGELAVQVEVAYLLMAVIKAGVVVSGGAEGSPLATLLSELQRVARGPPSRAKDAALRTAMSSYNVADTGIVLVQATTATAGPAGAAVSHARVDVEFGPSTGHIVLPHPDTGDDVIVGFDYGGVTVDPVGTGIRVRASIGGGAVDVPAWVAGRGGVRHAPLVLEFGGGRQGRHCAGCARVYGLAGGARAEGVDVS